MKKLLSAVIELVSNSPPTKVEQLVGSVRRLSSKEQASSLMAWAAVPNSRDRLQRLLAAWDEEILSPIEVAGMLAGASAAYQSVRAEQDIELVWTGPSSKLIATRKTEQALLEVIKSAGKRLFVTSFVAYDVASVMNAMVMAIDRGVAISMLLEASKKDGGGVSIDAIAKMKSVMPTAKIFSWAEKGDNFLGGSVHAKVAVADERICFVSSANLTGYAMERNMEAGVLIRGGSTPRSLQRHLEALETTGVIRRV
jgi:phosphatidylserine/phosphatidylglycerophosphate/cardiolipin synthase-like enzyme